jgi:hypothetical protein
MEVRSEGLNSTTGRSSKRRISAMIDMDNFRRLRVRKDQDGRSFSGQLNLILREYFREQGKKKKKGF